MRHGESFNNQLDDRQLNYDDYISQRMADPPLTELGFRQAQAVADHLAQSKVAEHFRNYLEDKPSGYSVTRIYCSAMLRAMQTAWPIGQALKIDPEVMIPIHEHGGLFQGDSRDPEKVVGLPGMTQREIQEQFPGYILPQEITEEGWWHGGYESLADCYGRAIRTAHELEQMAAQFEKEEKEERIVLVAHGTFIDGLIKALLNQIPNPTIYYVHYNTAITRIDFRQGQKYLHYINRTEHFTPELFADTYHNGSVRAEPVGLQSY